MSLIVVILIAMALIAMATHAPEVLTPGPARPQYAPASDLPGMVGHRLVLERRKPSMPLPSDPAIAGLYRAAMVPLDVFGLVRPGRSYLLAQLYCKLIEATNHIRATMSSGGDDRPETATKTMRMLQDLTRDCLAELGVTSATLDALRSHHVDGRLAPDNVYQSEPCISGGPRAAGILAHHVLPELAPAMTDDDDQ